MGGVTTTISLRKDEREAIANLMEKHHMKKHEVIKYALRRFLFPKEDRIPLNGRVAEPYPPYEGRMRVKNEGITIYDSEDQFIEIKDEETLKRLDRLESDLKNKPLVERKLHLSRLSEKDRSEMKKRGVLDV